MDHHVPRVKPILLDPDDITYLHCHHPGRDDPQPAYLVLRLSDGELLTEYDHDSALGNPPARLDMRDLEIWWSIPVLHAEAANALITTVIPEAQKILAGTRIHGDDHTRLAQLDDTALHYGNVVIPHLIGRYAETEYMITEMGAESWLTADGAITPASIACEYGITTSTSDAKLSDIAHAIEAKATQSGYLVLLGTLEYLTHIRSVLH